MPYGTRKLLGKSTELVFSIKTIETHKCARNVHKISIIIIEFPRKSVWVSISMKFKIDINIFLDLTNMQSMGLHIT